MHSLPFTPIERPLKVSLGKRYIVPVAQWLMRGNASGVLAVLGNSSWEAALSIIFLLDTKDLLLEESWAKEIENCDALIGQIDEKVLATVDWLLEQAQVTKNGKGELTNWDNLTWDTSVVLRSLLRVLNHYEAEDLRCYEQIEHHFNTALSWLIRAFNDWLEMSYTAGPQDVVELLVLVTSLNKSSPNLYKNIVGNSVWKGREEELSWKIVELVIKTRTETRQFPISIDTQEQTFALWWGEFFGTAEVLEGLAEFYRLALEQSQKLTNRQKVIINTIKETLAKAVLYFDYTQVDGCWGSAVTDTARVAMTYVQLTVSLPFLKSNSFVAFKALRWLCAESQIMKDGSFLHSLFLTIYYAMALMSYYKNWELADKPVINVYDIGLHEAHSTYGVPER